MTTLIEVRFNHDPDDGFFACTELLGDGLCDEGLVAVVFLGITFYFSTFALVDAGSPVVVFQLKLHTV